MDDVNKRLAEIQELNRIVQVSEAEARMRQLILELDKAQLANLDQPLRKTLETFLPKRRRALYSLLEEHGGGVVPISSGRPKSIATSSDDRLTARAFDDQLTQGLKELSERHIFQWSTFYRDFLGPVFSNSIDLIADDAHALVITTTLHKRVADHALEIFAKGYNYVRQVNPGAYAVTKSLAGLQRFLELPIEFYSAHATGSAAPRDAVALRRACSSMLAGALNGYGSVMFDDQAGWKLLPRYPRSWAHYLGFMTEADLKLTLDMIAPGAFREGVATAVIPIVSAIDSLATKYRDEYTTLPSLGQFDWNERRLDVSLHRAPSGASSKRLEIQCYVDAGYTNVHRLEEAANRDVSLIVAPLRPDVQDLVESHDLLRSIVVNSLEATKESASLTTRAREILEYAISRSKATASLAAPLTYNFARDFPLHNPFLSRYFHVYRSSVRNLMLTFERRNGVRLWCSVRRSGKTTACFDLGTTTGHSTVISQTCDGTHQREESDLFYKVAVEALETGRQISSTFFVDAVERCSPGRKSTDSRYVFVLDEYETLFERMQTDVRERKQLRYTVVQPLLNQMVAFSRENLLVLLGQRPDAHFIVMEQNQLSAYVQQDSFPLFTHDGDQSEFTELLRKVLTERVTFDRSFANSVHRETGGHPFLTVKVLVDLFDWLIAQRRSVRDLRLDGSDFASFSASRLNISKISAIATNKEYDFFRTAISEHVSLQGRQETPWLYAIYSCLQRLAEYSPTTLRCTRAEFSEIVSKLRITDQTGRSAEDLLSTGAQANFLSFNEEEVWPTIPILARISRTARQSVKW